MRVSDKLVFGIYAGSGLALDSVLGTISGPPDDLQQVKKSLDLLDQSSEHFLIRGYLQYIGEGKCAGITPPHMEQYTNNNGRGLDLAICFRPKVYHEDDWTNFIRDTILRYKGTLVKVQITEEPNNPDTQSGGDGSSPNILEAIVSGVIAAKDEVRKQNLKVQVGFNAVPSFDPNNKFWENLGSMSSQEFIDAVDYIGLDFYPGVFRPLPPGLTVSTAVKGVLHHFRNVNLKAGQFPVHKAIHVTENGWPTSETRTEEEQVTGIREMIDAIFEKRKELNITHYEFFDLRDADSSKPGLQFGLLRSDYTPKPAFDTFRELIAKYGVAKKEYSTTY